MELILWRHAEAEDASASVIDVKRRLTHRGEKQARHMAQWLRSHLPSAAKRMRVLVSPSIRTQQTAHALQLPFEIEPRVGLGGTPSSILTAAGWPNEERTVIVIGHQPTLGQLASLVMTGNEAEWSVKKGGVWWFSKRTLDEGEQVVLRSVINPDFL
jgi:phosphohistidine phosphatase